MTKKNVLHISINCFQFYKSPKLKALVEYSFALVPLFKGAIFCQRRTIDSKNKPEGGEREKVFCFSVRTVFESSRFQAL